MIPFTYFTYLLHSRHLNHLISEILDRGIPGLCFGSICVSKTYQQIRKLPNFGAKVCLTAVELQMFGY